LVPDTKWACLHFLPEYIAIGYDLYHNAISEYAERRLSELTLSPLIATVIFVLACLSGIQYRRVWKAEGPRWQLWLFGVLAALGLLIVGFVPLKT
jgi:hypothetical protein